MKYFMGLRRYNLNRFFEGNDDPPPNDDPPSDPPPNTDENTDKKFSQADVNKFVAEERRKAQQRSERTIKELEQLKKSSQLNEEEKQKIEERIETMRNEFLTKEELANKEAKKERARAKAELDAANKNAEKWKGLFEKNVLDNGLLSAASSDPDVFNVQQIVDLLQPRTRVAEEIDPETGNPTGNYLAKVKLPGKDKEGKDIILDLTPTEAVKYMKDAPDRYGNLFRSNISGGLGGNNLNTRTSGSPPTDPAQYREWRKKNKEFVGS